MDVIDTLTSLLDTKAKAILRPRSPMAANLFVLNNLSEVEKRVRGDRMMANVVGSIGVAEREREQSKRGSRGSSGSGVGSTSSATFAMPKSFEKAKRAGLDGTAPSSLLLCFSLFPVGMGLEADG